MHENSILITQVDKKSRLAITPHFPWNATVFLPSSLSISPWKEGFDINIYWKKNRAITIKTSISIIKWLENNPPHFLRQVIPAFGRSWACLRSRPTCDTFSLILNTYLPEKVSLGIQVISQMVMAYLRNVPLWAADVGIAWRLAATLLHSMAFTGRHRTE